MVTIQREPDAARIIFIEGLSGAPRLRDASVQLLNRMESGTEAAIDSVTTGEEPIDLPAIAVVGAIRNIVSRRLRDHGEDRLLRLVDPLADWITSYRLPSGTSRWTSETHPPTAVQIAAAVDSSRYEPFSRLPRGRHGLTPGQVIRSQRTRIIAATAQVTMDKGYASTTVADIVASAALRRTRSTSTSKTRNTPSWKPSSTRRNSSSTAAPKPTSRCPTGLIGCGTTSKRWSS